ncbi:MAG: PEGA domain-containing protein [Pseudomonadota bacterium]
MRTTLWMAAIGLAGWLPGSALADEGEGISIASLALARDSSSAQQAVLVDHLVRQSFERNPRYSPLDVEGLLSGDAPPPERALVLQGLEKLQRGREMYDAFELEPAVATLTEAVIAFERGAGALVDVTPYLRALQMLGATSALKADRSGARSAFARALLVDRRATLEGSGFPPTVLELYEEAREQVGQAAQATLSVYANPAAAEVYVDGVFRGSSPLTVDRLPAGRHLVRLYRAGYQGYGKVVELVANSEETLQAALKPTAQAAQFEGLVRRAGPEAAQDGMGSATKELGAWFKVDQLMLVQVTASGDDVTLQAAHYDAGAGQRLHAATRTFAYSSPRFRANVEEFILTEFRQAQLGVSSGQGTSGQIGSGYAPQRPDRPLHPGFLWGGVSLGVGVLPLAAGIVFTISAVHINDKLSKMPQIDPRSPDLMGVGQRDVFIATAGYAVTALLATTAVVLFIIAGTEEENVETILATPGSGGDGAAWMPVAAGGGR